MRFALALPLLLVLASPAEAEGEYDDSLRVLLHAVDPVAESLFFEGTRLADGQAFNAAIACFRQVTARLPKFWPAYRRAASCENRLGNRARAIEGLRWLVERDTSAYTLNMLADALGVRREGVDPTSAEIDEARRLVARARAQIPDDPSLMETAFFTSRTAGDPDGMNEAVAGLKRVAGSSPWTWYLAGMLAFEMNDVPGLRAAIAKARQTGLPADALAGLETTLATHERVRRLNTIANVGLWSIPVWLALLGLLTLAGLALSRATLTAADQALTGATGDAVGLDKWLRRAYSGVIAASAVYFYVSLPMLLFIVLATGAGIIWVMLTVHFVVVKLVLVVAFLTLVTMWAVLRSLFVRGDKSDPGERLDLAEQPRLQAVLKEVAERVGTRPVDTVFLTPGTDVAVFERGGWQRKLGGGGERCLVLGIGVLEGMKLGAWKAILAHEYGHFVNRDTAGGGMALAVRRSIMTMAVSMARGGAVGWYNPAWWFVRGFDAAFLRVSQGASRLQEVLADRWAALSYGAPAFRDGLTHVITASVRFDAVTDATLKHALRAKVPVANLYRRAEPLSVASELEVERLTQEALTREPEAYDSHPSPAQRFAWVEKVAASAPARYADSGDEEAVWRLFDDRTELEEYMTATVRTNVEQQYGVKFADVTDATDNNQAHGTGGSA